MNTLNTLYIRVKNNYGQTHYYPECKWTRLFTELTNTKTLTRANIDILKAYGYKFESIGEKI